MAEPRTGKYFKLSYHRMASLLAYSPDSGYFMWRYARSGISAGRAGTVTDKGYRKIRIDDIQYSEARLAFFFMTKHNSHLYMHHINGRRDDNRWKNLKEVSLSEHITHQKRNNSSGIIGVSWWTAGKKWAAQICISKKVIGLGHFEDIEDAAAARKTAEKERDMGILPINHHRKHKKKRRRRVKDVTQEEKETTHSLD